MPSLYLLVASGTRQRRLLHETIAEFDKKGYVVRARQEGGDWVSVLSDNMSTGLFDEKVLVIVESAELMGAMPDKLSEMIEKDTDIAILLVYDAMPNKFLSKEALKKSTILKPKEIPRWPAERQRWLSGLAKEKGININREALSLIVEMIEDTEEIERQLVSLTMLKKGGEVTAADVEALCFDDGNKNLLKLLDGLCNGDKVSSLQSLSNISKKGDLIPLMTALHNRMRLAWYASCNRGKEELFAKALEARNYAWRMAKIAAQRYNKDELTDFVIGLIRLNMAEKTGISAGWNSLECLVITLLQNQ